MQAQQNPALSPEAVRARAYELWEKHGRPEGHDLDYWLEAERDLAKEAASAGGIGNEDAPAPAKRARARKTVPAAKASTRTRTPKR